MNSFLFRGMYFIIMVNSSRWSWRMRYIITMLLFIISIIFLIPRFCISCFNFGFLLILNVKVYNNEFYFLYNINNSILHIDLPSLIYLSSFTFITTILFSIWIITTLSRIIRVMMGSSVMIGSMTTLMLFFTFARHMSIIIKIVIFKSTFFFFTIIPFFQNLFLIIKIKEYI